MFNNIEEKDHTSGLGLKLPYFFNLVKITGFDYHKAKTGSILIKLELESKEDDENFEGFERIDGKKAKGKLATVDLGIYTKPDNFKSVANILTNLVLISSKANIDYNKYLAPIFLKAIKLEDKTPVALKEETGEYYLKVIKAIVNVFIKHGNYFWMFVTAEEYKPGKYGNYAFLTYNIGDKNNYNFIPWVKSEGCITNIFKGDGNLKDFIVGVEGKNLVGNNKGETFKKMVEVENEYQLKPYKEGEYEDELESPNTMDLNEDENPDDDLPF